ncbi:MAG: cyclic nucleotide-binding domain-containing protein [Bacteroidetes bacterium]|nr:cyclic nucleotide-binding domain-containing protein [Bacteroidota bacterium]MBK8659079.1 cyclic nucleotide-binding domain-containing protein [Bacteroidota bacterium]
MSHSSPKEQRLLLIEKVLLLKSLSIFEETPETVLAEVAEILEEEEFEAGQRIFNAGEVANCMYIIFKGEVKIHAGDHTLAVLKENDFFGELSLLDTETRSASATVLGESLLLKINQEPFYELMESRIEVAKGIIKTLCRRLRAQNVKSVQQSNK